MKERKKMIGKNNFAIVGHKVVRFCGIANQQVIPLLKHFEIPLDEETIRRAVANRSTVLEIVIDRTLQSEEYVHQPELLKKAVTDIIVQKVEAAITEYGNDTATEEAEFSTFDSSTDTIRVDEKKIDQTREIWICGEANITIWEDYCAAAEALNKLFNGHVPGHRLALFFKLPALGCGVAAPDLSTAPNFTEIKKLRGE